MLWRVGLGLVVLAGCARPVKVERRELPVDTGLPIPFVADGPRRWDFGDGSPAVEGAQVRHAFHRAGRFEVRGLEGDAVREQIAVVVQPRGVFRLVPPDVDWAVAARGLEELPGAVDFAERLTTASAVQDWLDGAPAVAFALEQAAGAARVLDPREGLAVFAWEDDGDARFTVVGVTEPRAALTAFEAWLAERGWTGAGVVAGLLRFEKEAVALDVFVDRGALYAVTSSLTTRRPSAQARVGAASALGLEADGAVATALDQLPSGGLALFARGPEDRTWGFATGAIRVKRDEARVEGAVASDQPLWTAPPVPKDRLLSRAPEGPVVVASANLEPEQLAALVLGPPGSPRRTRFDAEVLARGADVERGVHGVGGLLEGALYFDVVGFVRSTLASGGRPVPQGSLLLEAPVADAAPVEALIDALGARAELELVKSREKGLRLWRGSVSDRPLQLALTAEALFVQGGSSLADRSAADLLTPLAASFEGAFGPGHVSIAVDLAQLRKELLQPRLIDDVDPRRALTAQALAVTFLDRLTSLDLALLDAVPTERGAAVQLVLRLRPRAKE